MRDLIIEAETASVPFLDIHLHDFAAIDLPRKTYVPLPPRLSTLTLRLFLTPNASHVTSLTHLSTFLFLITGQRYTFPLFHPYLVTQTSHYKVRQRGSLRGGASGRH